VRGSAFVPFQCSTQWRGFSGVTSSTVFMHYPNTVL